MLHEGAWGVRIGMHCVWQCILHEDVHGVCKRMRPDQEACTGSVHGYTLREGEPCAGMHREHAWGCAVPDAEPSTCSC